MFLTCTSFPSLLLLQLLPNPIELPYGEAPGYDQSMGSENTVPPFRWQLHYITPGFSRTRLLDCRNGEGKYGCAVASLYTRSIVYSTCLQTLLVHTSSQCSQADLRQTMDRFFISLNLGLSSSQLYEYDRRRCWWVLVGTIFPRERFRK